MVFYHLGCLCFAGSRTQSDINLSPTAAGIRRTHSHRFASRRGRANLRIHAARGTGMSCPMPCSKAILDVLGPLESSSLPCIHLLTRLKFFLAWHKDSMRRAWSRMCWLAKPSHDNGNEMSSTHWGTVLGDLQHTMAEQCLPSLGARI